MVLLLITEYFINEAILNHCTIKEFAQKGTYFMNMGKPFVMLFLTKTVFPFMVTFSPFPPSLPVLHSPQVVIISPLLAPGKFHLA